MFAHITESIHHAAETTIGYKINKKRKKSYRLPQPILALIKEKNHLVKQLKDCPLDLADQNAMIRRSLVEVNIVALYYCMFEYLSFSLKKYCYWASKGRDP